MKNKIIFILNILVVLFCGTLVVLHFTGIYEISTKNFTKAGVLLVTYVLGVLNYLSKTKGNRSNTTHYAELYQHIIRDAFADDKTGYRELMQGIALFDHDRFDKAIRHLSKLEDRCTTRHDTSAVLFFIAKSYSDKGEISKAVQTYERLLKFDPTCSTAWSNLGLIHHNAGRVADAKYALNQAILYNPENPYAHCNLANVLYRNGEFEEAKNYGLKAFELNNQLPAAASVTALCYACLGDAENARKFCKIYGTSEDNKDLVAMVERQLNSSEL